MCSFQMQAATGRGIKGKRSTAINFQSVIQLTEHGVGTHLSFESVLIGHPDCQRLSMTAVAGGVVIDLLDDHRLVEQLICKSGNSVLDYINSKQSTAKLLWLFFQSPTCFWLGVKFIVRKLFVHWKDLLRARFRLRRLTFFCKNFMDTDNLNVERIHHCSFKVASGNGAISMCLYNVIREEVIRWDLTCKEPICEGKNI